jgi:hypothetical protein
MTAQKLRLASRGAEGKRFTADDIRQEGGQFCGSLAEGPLFWFKDRSVGVLMADGRFAVAH